MNAAIKEPCTEPRWSLTRKGDVSRGVTVADPAAITRARPTSTPATAAAGPALDGTYRVDYDWAKQTANGDSNNRRPHHHPDHQLVGVSFVLHCHRMRRHRIPPGRD